MWIALQIKCQGVILVNGLQYIRKAHGMSLDTLGKRMGITRQTISQWEHGVCTIPENRLKELSQIFGIPEYLFGEVTEYRKQEINVLLKSGKAESNEAYLFAQHEAALRNERNIISRIDYYLKGKGREFHAFEDLISFIDGETKAFNSLMDIVSNDTLRSVLYSIIGAFNRAEMMNDRAELTASIKSEIVKTLENSEDHANAAMLFSENSEAELY